MSLVEIWRVQHRVTHLGPYSEYATQSIENLYAHGSCPNHPSPAEDLSKRDLCQLSYRPQISILCGCKSIEQISLWFDGCIPGLIKFGYVLTRWQVHKKAVWYGQYQIVFDRRKAKLVESNSLSVLMENV